MHARTPRAQIFSWQEIPHLTEPVSRPQKEPCSKRKAVYKGAAPVQKRCGDKVHSQVS